MIAVQIIIFCVIVNVKCFETEALHNFMTVPELAYYFNTEDKKLVPNYEVVYLLTVLPIREAVSENGEPVVVDYEFTAFGSPVSLKLKRNENLVAPSFKTYLRNGDTRPEFLPYSQNCHYLHKDYSSAAAVSVCQPNSMEGLVFLPNTTLEISPLTPHLYSILKLREPLRDDTNVEQKAPHIVRRSPFLPNSLYNDIHTQKNKGIFKMNHKRNKFNMKNLAASSRPAQDLTLEVAVFFDEPGYKIFSPYMDYDDVKIRDMLLAYINGVQALYHHPSLGTSLEIVIVRMDIMKTQPSDMPHFDGERSNLLDSFCDYQRHINPSGDENPDHWDMALYVSGLDFFAYENGRKNGVTMGLAAVGGVCLDKYACVIAELGTTNIFGKPYPSAGFTSVYIMAHEIGHNLGMHHDNSGNNCPKEGYVMSPSRGTKGETQWSTCSAEIMSQLSWAKCLQDSAKQPPLTLDHSRFLDTPGQSFTVKKQCEILLRDKDAVMSPNQELSTICYSLQCKTPHRSGYYFAGPALQGTECGKGKYCYGGDCVTKTVPKPITVVPGGWGPWKSGTCHSSCLENSKGHQIRRRVCNNPLPVNTDKGCEGASYDTVSCTDEEVCKNNKRKSAVEFASDECRKFSKLLPQLDPKGAGLQAPHEEVRLWMGCAIFCRRGDSGSYYTPRIELNDLGVSPYFPDGTWCHNHKGTNYYCLQHHCLPENFEFSKTSILDGMGEDIPLSQNAHPYFTMSSGLQSYLSLGSNGKPLQTSLRPDETMQPREEDWETRDYIELPDDDINKISKNDYDNSDHFFDFM